MLLNKLVKMESRKKQAERGNSEQAIMEAAEALFLENGYNMTTTTMIAAKAGVTHAMLHYYFRTKEHIFMKVLDKYMDELLESFQPLMKKDAPFWETMESGISAHFDFMMERPQLPALLFDTIRFNPELLETYKERVSGIIRRVMSAHGNMLEQEMAAGRVRKVDPVQLMIDIISLNFSAFLLLPAARKMFDGVEKSRGEEILAGRKAEIIALIKSRLYGE